MALPITLMNTSAYLLMENFTHLQKKKMTLHEQLLAADGHRFQEKLGNFIAEKKLQTIMEIGSGVSSLFILKAFEDAGIDGMLHSIDTGMWYPHKIEHPKFKEWRGQSIYEMVNVFLKYGAPDLILSDGKHEIKDMTYEYEFGYAILKPNGYLVADDTTFGNNGAWEDFLNHHDLKDSHFGDARIIQKQDWIPVFDDIEDYHFQVLEVAENVERMFLEKGGTLSDVAWHRV